MFNSKSEEHRNPVGAVSKGTKIHFKISPQRLLEVYAASLVVEDERGCVTHFDMYWCGMNGSNHEWWECHFVPETSGIYFYRFEIRNKNGVHSVFKDDNSLPVISNKGNKWQITVFEKDFDTPDWLKGGVIYQIFPDRFFNSNSPKTDVPEDRYIHGDWNEDIHWAPNEKGVITNSDYFGGDLLGITQKLSYIKSLGVTCIYLNPIFESHSNHRYDTADYSKIDPLLGSEEDFKNLCASAKKLGIHVIIDGVFNHTGSDSLYFNRQNRYETQGAYNCVDSPYYSWYSFKKWPNDYSCWWNFITLPNVNEQNPDYQNYIVGDNGIIEKWIKLGASGWRLDVVDELPDNFLDRIYTATKRADKEAIVMGEVWEDASTKCAYGARRRYLLGRQMDTVMNYPFRSAILSFVSGADAAECIEQIESIVENYPPQCLNLLMNHIGTHDTERAITLLAGEPLNGNDRQWQNSHRLSDYQYVLGVFKLKLATLMQFTLPGVPSIYYGDEAGMQGYKDPFNRGTFPWGKEDKSLQDWHRELSKLRQDYDVFKDGKLRTVYAGNCILAYERYKKTDDGEDVILVALNSSDRYMALNLKTDEAKTIIGTEFSKDFKLPPYGYSVFYYKKEEINKKP